jgi:hypothetical protein
MHCTLTVSNKMLQHSNKMLQNNIRDCEQVLELLYPPDVTCLCKVTTTLKHVVE